MYYKLDSTLKLLFLLFITQIYGECPEAELIDPCLCVDDEIYCIGDKPIDLTIIFNDMRLHLDDNQKHFKIFYLNSSVVTTLKANTFQDIVFDEIYIKDMANLMTIDRNAFTKTNFFTKFIEINNNLKLTNDRNSVLEALSRFEGIQQILFNNNNQNLNDIPSNAFQPLNGFQDKLKYLDLGGYSTIGDNAFFYLNHLQDLYLWNSQIKSLPEHVFNFERPSDAVLNIYLSHSPNLNSTVFFTNSLAYMQRPVNLVLGPTDSPIQITFLEERVFMPFLFLNKQNTIELIGETFDCNDCRSFWIMKHPFLVDRLTNLTCANGKELIDSANFNGCQV